MHASVCESVCGGGGRRSDISFQEMVGNDAVSVFPGYAHLYLIN